MTPKSYPFLIQGLAIRNFLVDISRINIRGQSDKQMDRVKLERESCHYRISAGLKPCSG